LLFIHIFPEGLHALAAPVIRERMPMMVLYGLFFSALIVGVRTDLQDLVVFQMTTIWLVPLGVIAAFFGFTYVTGLESLAGALLGYGMLWLVAILFRAVANREGVGAGDMEMAALIGSFLGPLGVWFSIMLGSCIGLVVGGGYLLLSARSRATRIPFVPFLALGAALFFFCRPWLLRVFLGW